MIKNSVSYWTKQEMNSLKEDYYLMPQAELETKYHRSFEAIKKKAQSLGVRRRRRPYDLPITLQDLKTLYLSGLSCTKLAQQFGTSTTKINYLLSEADTKFRTSKNYKTYEINHEFFDLIDSEEKAYFLGFLYADGYNNNIKGSISINLQEGDGYILEKFSQLVYKTKRPLYSKPPKGNSKPQVALTISNRYMSDKLQQMGCIQRKSLVLEFPNINSDLHHHFIRGYFDGDGCITINKQKQFHFNIVGTRTFLTELQRILVDNCNLNFTKIADKKTVATFSYCGTNVCKRIR